MRYCIKQTELFHHGVKGMKWGVRKQKKAQQKWERNVAKNWYKAYNKAADEDNKRLPALNAKYEKFDLNKDLKARKKYVTEFVEGWHKTYEKHLVSEFGKPIIDDGRTWAQRVPMMYTVDDLYNNW